MKKIGIVVNIKRKEALNAVLTICKWLETKKTEFNIDIITAKLLKLPEKSLPHDLLAKESDLILVLGGDGTLLSIARYASKYNIPILAVNLGSLGFLTEVKLEEVFDSLNEVIKNKFVVEKRMMLQAKVIRQNKIIQNYTALNDIVISRETISRLVHIETHINGKYVTTFHADGLIISTPTGSTAYSLSAGGPIVHPEIEVLLLSPICSHTLTNRPLIISKKNEICNIIKSKSNEVVLTVDGQVCFHLQQKDIIKISKARSYVNLIVPKNRNYYEVLRNKLKWGS